jgi:regulatory protein
LPPPDDQPIKKWTGKLEALQKLQSFCAYQDRCHSEVRSKFIEEDFLNEERFARSYARGKFRIKQWGRVRIRQELKRRQISEYCIKAAFSEIEDDDYRNTLHKLLSKQKSTLKSGDERTRRDKLFRHALQKGYESELILEVLDMI